jgi:hypothetical protein
MSAAHGFAYACRADGTVVITHHGRVAATLRGGRAARFLDEVGDGDEDGDDAQAQLAMARWTGNYRHGNERTAKRHPRNR